MRVEAEVLVACLSGWRRPAAVRERLGAAADVDWNWLLHMAGRHHILPVVARVLNGCCADLLPAPVLEHLQAYAVAVSLRNAYMTAELLEVLEVFQGAGLAAISFKGPVLAATVYGDAALRQFSDLDLLIRPRDVQAARNLLVERGYHLDPPFNAEQTAYVAGLVGDRATDYLRSRSEHHFVRSGDNMTIDLHLALADPYIHFALQVEDLFTRGEWVILEGRRLRSLSPEDTLLMLCVNGAKDGWVRLQRASDVAALLAARPDLDAAVVLARARSLAARRMLRVSLLLARDLAGAALPAVLARDLVADAAAHSLVREVQAGLFEAQERRPELSLAYARAYVRTRERVRDRLWFYLHLVITPGVSDWRVVALPRGLRCLYFLLRPIRLVWTYGRSSLRSLHGTGWKSRPVSRR